jgi:hypothetical protein
MLNHSVESALGYLILSFLTWSITFTVLVFGVILRRKILLWDDRWKEKLEEEGVSVKDYAEDLELTYEKVRYTFRLLGFFLLMILALMAYVVYLGTLDKPILGFPQMTSSLWLLALVALSFVLPAFVNFAVGAYLTETMLLKANAFVYRDLREEIQEKKAKLRVMEKAKQIKAQREALRGGPAAAPTPAPEAQNPAPAGK